MLLLGHSPFSFPSFRLSGISRALFLFYKGGRGDLRFSSVSFLEKIINLGKIMNFNEFWSLYPRKVARKDALTAWNKLSTEKQEKAQKAISSHLKMWAAECRLIQFTPHAASWLNAERFEDEIQIPEPELKTPSNVLAFAKAKQIDARPGESMEEFTQRLRMTRWLRLRY